MYKPYNKAVIHFSKIDEIGQDGRNSKVYTVHDRQLDAEIVIKEIAKNTLIDPNIYYQESQLLYKSSHPNVVQIHYACEDDNNIYIGMPFYKKGSLKKKIDSKELTVRQIIRYSLQLLCGLHNIHSKGLIHFDVKPDNVLLSERDEALLSDFGLAKTTNLTGLANQDRNYLKHRPPEAFDSDHFDITYDIYQVGLTLYRMCVGNEVFYSQFSQYIGTDGIVIRDRIKFDVQNGRFPNRDIYPVHIPIKLQKIINKCLSINPDDRYNSCMELSNALSDIDDKGIDWYHTITPDSERWERNCEDKKIVLLKDATGFKARKQFNSGSINNISKCCKVNLTNTELHAFFEEY